MKSNILKYSLLRFSVIFAAIVSLVPLSSCHHTPIDCSCTPTARIYVRYDWSNAPCSEVKGMTLVCYPLWTEGEIWRFELSGKEGGWIELPPGNYNFVTVNNDLPGITVSTGNYADSFFLESRPYGTAGLMRPTAMAYGCSGDFYAATCKELLCKPDSLCTVYLINFHPVGEVTKGKLPKSLACILKGPAKTLAPATMLTSPEAVSIPVALAHNDHYFSGKIEAFGQPHPLSGYEVTVEMTTANGLWQKKYDVTNQVVNSVNQKFVVIEITDQLPSDSNQGSMDADVGVDGWQQVIINLGP